MNSAAHGTDYEGQATLEEGTHNISPSLGTAIERQADAFAAFEGPGRTSVEERAAGARR